MTQVKAFDSESIHDSTLSHTMSAGDTPYYTSQISDQDAETYNNNRLWHCVNSWRTDHVFAVLFFVTYSRGTNVNPEINQ